RRKNRRTSGLRPCRRPRAVVLIVFVLIERRRRRKWCGRVRRPGRGTCRGGGHGRHHGNRVVQRRVGGSERDTRRGDVAAQGAKQHVERFAFGHVFQFEREGTAGNTLGVDDLRPA